MPAQHKCPDFVFVGTGKTGTTWLHHRLREHPDLFLPAAKETNFFDLNYQRGLCWYAGFFAPAQSHQKIGEISHRYIHNEFVAARIKQTLGTVKIIITLRDPVDYFLSDYLFSCSNGSAHGSLDAFYHTQFDWACLDYPKLIHPYLTIFGTENILLSNYGMLKIDPQSYLDQITDFIGVSRHVLSPEQKDRVNPARCAKRPMLAHSAGRISKALKRRGGQNLVAWVKRQDLVQSLLFERLEQKPRLPSQIEHQIQRRSETPRQWLTETFGPEATRGWG